MSEENVQVQGRSWKDERFLSSFFEADMLRKSLLLRNEGHLEVKVKRCGERGALYVVKSRELVVKNTEEKQTKERKNKKSI